MSRETQKGWMASLLIHAFLLLLFFFLAVPEIMQKQEFIEVTWGSSSIAPIQREATRAPGEPSRSAPPAAIIKDKSSAKKKPAQPVILPERRMTDLTNEVLPERRAEKLETPEQGTSQKRVTEGGLGEREDISGRNAAEKERSDPSTVPGSSVGVTPGPGGVGEGVEKGVSFSIQWAQGGARRKISGDLPTYPKGVNVQAQIKILAVVLPDGSVRSTQPAQKANTDLEEAAMKEVRFWKFEPLRSSQPQVEQSCLVTFLFTLK